MTELVIKMYDGSLKHFHDFKVIASGVVVPITKKTEMFFPWHRVEHIAAPIGTFKD